ncbi:transposase [Fimbriiglobus ruber]|uniref:Transposase n=1 Tax=Fimbriiglobus ruber TaxID=1908690 RepID=A0A225DMN5_9BACT|nr:transposase [Fimbriiglobus ruber]OWK40884.1 Transposase [Fimbriiglobus ruber]
MSSCYPDLYHHRWRLELNIRDLKQALGMAHLRGHTPEMMRREIWAHLLAYNVIRQVIAQAAQVRECSPRQIRFAGAKQALEALRVGLQVGEGDLWGRHVEALLRAIGGHRIGTRPGRSDPWAVKRRPKIYARMT